MRTAAALLALFLLPGTLAQADTLKMKNGQTKEGRILAENDGQILFQQSNGDVSEVAATSVSIIDRAVVPGGKAGQVSFFTTSPRKKKKAAPPPSEETAPVDASVTLPALEGMSKPPAQDPSLDNMDRMLQDWLEKHPDMKEWLETAADKAIKRSAEMNDLLDQAKQS